jgi:LL-H family phage holin
MNALVTTLIPYVVPVILIILGYFGHRVISYIPAEQRAYLEQWAKMAVAYVEQNYAGKSDEEKKQIAMDAIKAFFKAFKLPCPPDAILSTAIESAVKFLDATLQGGKTA